VLKDGASAIYGTDAIGGVINFILRKDVRGVEVSGYFDKTEDGGGDFSSANILAGLGSLGKDRFNVMASLAYDKQDRLNGNQRAFSNGFQPERGLSPDTTGTPFATHTGLAGTAIGSTFRTPNDGTQTFNRANLLSFQGRCDIIPGMSQYQSALWGSPGFKYGCAFDYGGSAVLIQAAERTNLVSRGTLQLAPDTNVFAEITASRSVAQKQFEPYQITTVGSIAGAQYPVGGPYYQDLSAFIPSFNRNLPIAYRWRCNECGKRTIETTTDSYRFLVGIEGAVLGKWDYKLGVSRAGSEAESLLGEGYLFQSRMVAALASGQVNPWLLPGQTQTPAAMALLANASAAGTRLFGGKAGLTQFDGAISGEAWQLPAGPLALAAGFDVRKESYLFRNGATATEPIYQAPFDAEFPEVSRTIKAVYAEAAVPIIRNLEATLAVRHDKYSDFGGTTNPKVSLKWNPVRQVMFRGSYNEGFRAPSFFQLYGATGESPVPGNIADPVLCPQNPTDLSVCAIRPNARQGGNRDLKPEISKQWTIGAAVSPIDWMTATIDLWEIKRTDRIYELTPQQVIANYTTFPENLVRGTNGRLDGPGGYIRAGFVNADGDITRGVDLSLSLNGRHRANRWNARLDGTYIDSFRSRVFSTQPYTEFAGQWSSRDIYPRWKHNAAFTYIAGPWRGTLTQSYTAGYKDERPVGVVPPGFKEKVESYITYNAQVSYSGINNLTITAGIKNLFNTDPPFTAHNLDFAAGAGWDPRVADPRGRSYTVRATYKFM
jgi:iron complex outermembrane receptor protein